ncbi:MAG TPA: M3 family metallopeptidase, partial [Anaerolineae bacterium]
MTLSLPKTSVEFALLEWEQIAKFYSELQARDVGADSIDQWLADWTELSRLINETGQRLYVATSVNTADVDAEKRLFYFLEHINPPAESAEQKLREKLLATHLDIAGFEIPLRNMRAQMEQFREENLKLFTDERKLENEYNKVIGSQTVNWQDKEITVTQLRPVYYNPDRALREKAWRLASARQLADRDAINKLWGQFMDLRKQQALNADCPDYREFRWKQLLRFDYTPHNCAQFHDAIEQAVVPAAERIYARRRKQLGLETLRPWDLDVDPSGLPPLRPYQDTSELISKTSGIFNQLDPRLGEYFDIMRKENLL